MSGLLLVMAVLVASPADASDGRQIESKQRTWSGRPVCLEIDNGSAEVGASAVVDWCDPSAAHQQWDWRKVSKNGYRLEVAHTGYCLARDGSAGDDRVVQAPCTRRSSQKWKSVKASTVEGTTYYACMGGGQCLPMSDWRFVMRDCPDPGQPYPDSQQWTRPS